MANGEGMDHRDTETQRRPAARGRIPHVHFVVPFSVVLCVSVSLW